MANWQGAKVTNKGLALIAKITAGNTKLNITRIAFGSGNLTNIDNAERLVREIDNAEIITKVQKNNTCTVTVRLTNANFNTAQNIAEIGIFATDPDEGEILFAGMVDANPDFVQAASSSTLVAKTVTMGIGYSNSDNVTISLSNSMWVTAEEVLTMITDELRKYGNNTHRINDAVVAANTAQTITSLTDMIGNRIKAITGEKSWVGNPVNNIKGIQSSITDLLTLVVSLPVDNIKDFNKQVISALDQEKLTALGVKYNFDNPNAWSISFGKLFGGLILQGRVSELNTRVNRVGAGAAALAALHPLDFDPDDKWDFAAGYGNYSGANAVAIGAYYRPNEDTMFSVGGSFGGGENMVNAGVSVKLGQGNHVTTSRVAMAKEIKDLRAEVEVLRQAVTGIGQGQTPDSVKMKLFPDIAKNHWAYEAVEELTKQGLLEGYPDGTFGGDRMMTRYEFAEIVYRAMQKGLNVNEKLIQEFEPELERFRIDVISKDKNGNPVIERVRVNEKRKAK